MNMSPSSTALYQEEFGNASPPRCTIMDDADTQEMGTDCQLPPFNPQDARKWFREAEDIFIEKKILRQASKFYHVVQILPTELSGSVYDLMYTSGSVQNVYDKLRDQIIAESYKRQKAISTQKILQGLENRYTGKRKHEKIAPVLPYGMHFMAEMKHDTGMQGPKMKRPRISVEKCTTDTQRTAQRHYNLQH